MAYVSWGALGKAFQRTDRPAVVLIDEIDKADIDFPNDLLTVLDDPREFRIREVDQPPIRATLAPIIIITSNKEKGNLPQPFLRRCIYSYIRFPSAPDQLKRIIAAHQRSTERPVAVDDRLTDAAVRRFLDLRDKDDLFKKPGTSELLDWLQALARAVLRGKAGGQEATIGELVARLENPEAPLPFPELLFKLQADWRRYVPAAER
jgi:MoxR-like ATPase